MIFTPSLRSGTSRSSASRRFFAAYTPLTAALMLVLAIGPAAVTQETADTATVVDLRPRWTEGQTTRYEFWNRIEQTAAEDFAGRSRSQTTTIEITGEITWTVDKIADDGSSTCTMLLDWMLFSSTPEEGDATVVDSRKPAKTDTKVMHDLLSAMAAVTVTVEVAPDGHITKVDGLDKMKKLVDNEELIPSELDFQETASDLASIAYAPPGSDAGLAAGHKWKADFRWDHEMGKMDQRWDYQLDRVEDIAGLPVAVVTGSAKFKFDPELPDRPAGAPPVNVKLVKGEADTEILFDLSRREAVGRHTSAREEIAVTVTFPDGRKFVRTMSEAVTGQVLRIEED